MNYDALTEAYWRAQSERVEALRQKISSRPSIGAGRVVPEDDDLTIGDGRRLYMAVMFLDISRFSGRMLETVEEQDLMLRVLNLFFTEMIRIAEEYGGNVEKNTGDGLMVYFNDGEGNPAEGGVKRAVAAALTMMKANNDLITPVLRTALVEEIQFRVSIEYGQVSIARLGAPRRFNANVAIGTAANFASKMLKHAEPGDIVLGANARSQLPVEWQDNWTQQLPVETGWIYRMSRAAYELYRYTGRWNRLA